MSRIGEIFGKLFRNRDSSMSPSYHKMSPDEVELRAFQERDRLDNVRVQLEKMRKKHSMLNNSGGINIYKKQDSLLKGNSLSKQQKKILNSGGMFW